MYKLKTIYNDYSTCCYDFIVGIDCLSQRDINKAVNHFSQACSLTPNQHYNFSKYQSYLGLANVLAGDQSGIQLCHQAIEEGEAEGDHFLNLARAEWFCRNRLATLTALSKGLDIEAEHAGLNEMRVHLGVRRSNPIAFLPRRHYLNCLLGKILRKK